MLSVGKEVKMNKILFLGLGLIVLCGCDIKKNFVVGQDAFCVGLEETSTEPVFCKDAKGYPITGKVIQYYQNGNVYREMTIRQGKENGLEKEYYENGNLKVELNVKNGVADGKAFAYNEDGKLYMETVWKEGKISTAKVYDANGEVTANTEGM